MLKLAFGRQLIHNYRNFFLYYQVRKKFFEKQNRRQQRKGKAYKVFAYLTNQLHINTIVSHPEDKKSTITQSNLHPHT